MTTQKTKPATTAPGTSDPSMATPSNDTTLSTADAAGDPTAGMSEEQKQALAMSQMPGVTLVAGSVEKAMDDAGATPSPLWMVPRRYIRVIEGFNVRIQNAALQAHIASLADSMLSEGFKLEHPLSGYVAREGDESIIYISDGHCRLQGFDKAVSEGADLDRLPVVVNTQQHDIAELSVVVVRSATSKPLEALEKAALVKRLKLYGWDEKRISARCGFTTTYVRDLLALIEAPVQVRELVQDNKISATAALQAMAKHGEKAAEKITEGLQAAEARGKTRVTSKFMQDPGEKIIERSGTALYGVAQEIKADPAFASLEGGLRKKLEDLIAQIEDKRQRALQRAKDKEDATAKALQAPGGHLGGSEGEGEGSQQQKGEQEDTAHVVATSSDTSVTGTNAEAEATKVVNEDTDAQAVTDDGSNAKKLATDNRGEDDGEGEPDSAWTRVRGEEEIVESPF
ncbi:hypothetical protein [Hydrogenophaga sp.]|uniref:hypothetical protein n=2 Tax=Hydrogenophaga sp. TaxID=1904254 RepID=UPI002631CA87|nr:hypothetical protein [Hydrogenophaga sp.]